MTECEGSNTSGEFNICFILVNTLLWFPFVNGSEQKFMVRLKSFSMNSTTSPISFDALASGAPRSTAAFKMFIFTRWLGIGYDWDVPLSYSCGTPAHLICSTKFHYVQTQSLAQVSFQSGFFVKNLYYCSFNRFPLQFQDTDRVHVGGLVISPWISYKVDQSLSTLFFHLPPN